MPPRRLVLGLALLAAPLAVPAAALAVEVAVPAGATGAAACTSTPYEAARAGLVTVQLDGRTGDWDLALVRTSGERQGSAGFGPRERAFTYLTAGEVLDVRVCRRAGTAETADLAFDLHPMLPQPDERVQLVDVPLRAEGDHERLEATGLDVTHAHDDDSAKVVLYGADDLRRLTAAGFTATTVVPDLRSEDERLAAEDLAYARSTTRSALPSGRTAYRTFEDYGTDMKALAAARPDLVKPITIGRSLEGRPIQGLEISADVAREDDGKPAIAVVGLHHAREWPSGEMPMEFATTLVKEAADPRIASLLGRVRVIVLPMMNPDGFMVSRSFGVQPVRDDNSNLTLADALNDADAYKRKNCRPATAESAARPCVVRAPEGVDLNRNYGAFYGGAGTSTMFNAQNFRGAGPFSEPESEAFHKLSQTREITNVISHHTFTAEGVWLRQIGFCFTQPCSEDDVSEDEAGMKALGDAMGAATGWQSLVGWKLGPPSGTQITGATEDWNYFATGAYGYTPEQRGANFHPNYATAVVAEYDGTAAPMKGGVREALLLAAEQAADPAGHAVLEGRAPAGRTLRLVKTFDTPTSIPGTVVKDRLDLTTRTRADGRYEWHVNQSTRPKPVSTGPEAYTLTCEDDAGTVLETRSIVVARGERLTIDLACGAQASAPPTPAAPAPAPPVVAGESAAGAPAPVLVGGSGAILQRPGRAPLRLSAASDRQRRSSVLRRGLRVRVRCSAACAARVVIRPRGARASSRAWAAQTVRLPRGGRTVVRVRLTRSARRALAARRRDLIVTVTLPGARSARYIARLSAR